MSDGDAESSDECQQLSADVKHEAHRLGFDLVGIAPAVTPTGFSALSEWLDRGYAGEMAWVERRVDAYEHPRRVLEGVRSIVVLGIGLARYILNCRAATGCWVLLTCHG